MVGILVLIIGIAIVVIPVLDVLLSKSQKKAVARWFVRARDWLDWLKRTSLIDSVRRPAVRLTYAAVVVLLLWGKFSFPVVIDASHRGLDMVFVEIATFWLCFPMIVAMGIDWTIGGRNPGIMLARSSVIFGPVGILLIFYFICLSLPRIFPTGLPRFYYEGDPTDVLGSAGIMALLCLWVWLVAIAPLALAYAMSGALVTGEFVVRRIAEYPKGPIVAVGVILAAVGGIIKLLT